jgi:amidase
MVPVAFGTQTIGSVIRPASFCGAVGYKPTFALLPRVGVKAISDCLDTVGCFTRSVADAAFFVARLSRRALDVPADMAAPRIGLCLTPQWPQAQPETVALFDTLASRLGGAGAVVREFALPQPFNDMNAAQDLVAAREMAECLADEHLRQPQLLGERLRRQLDHGRAIDAAAYDAAMALARVCRRGFNELLGDLDVLVVPSSPGEAPAGLGFTGDPVFNRTWSFLHTPCVHVPLTFGPRGLPLGLQVVGRIGDDARALACAHWVEERLRAPETRRLP